jgi:hypothetical protein
MLLSFHIFLVSSKKFSNFVIFCLSFKKDKGNSMSFTGAVLFFLSMITILKKVKCTLVQAVRLCRRRTAHRGSRGIALLFLDQRHSKGLRGQRHAPAALYSLEWPGTHCTGGWVCPRAGLERCGKSRLTWIRSQDRSHSLYRLSYRPTITILGLLKIYSFISNDITILI